MANIGTGTVDSNGIQRISSNSILFSKFIDVSESSFANPDVTYYGYASDGFYREAGVAVASPATGQPAKASWASEGEHAAASATRNTEDAFPNRIFVILTTTDLVILNADTLTVWMRFTQAAGTAITSQYFLGGGDSTPFDADFDSGVLVVTFNDLGTPKMNLMIADFRSDKMMRINEATGNSTLPGKTLRDRNSAIWSATGSNQIPPATGVVSLASGNALPGTRIYNVSMVTNLNKTYIATGTNEGLSITVLKLGPSGYTAATKNVPQLFAKEYSGVDYNAVDDMNGDAYTDVFTASNSSAWLSDGVREGDYLCPGASTDGLRIKTVAPPNLILHSAGLATSVSASGGSYRIVRPVQRVLFHNLASLFYSNGENFIVKQTDQTYQSTRVDIDPWTSPDYSSYVPFLKPEDYQIRGDHLYLATDVGVYKIDTTGPSSGLDGELVYSGPSGDGTYKILSSSATSAITVDTESGHLVVATFSGGAARIVEIDVDNFHQIVKEHSGGTFTQRVNSLMGYTNPDGPPTVSVS